jgi:hypothetical protein
MLRLKLIERVVPPLLQQALVEARLGCTASVSQMLWG